MIEAKPLRIIGGYDPQNTNNFLQLLSIAAKHMPDSRNAVITVLEQEGGDEGNSLMVVATGDRGGCKCTPLFLSRTYTGRRIEIAAAIREGYCR